MTTTPSIVDTLTTWVPVGHYLGAFPTLGATWSYEIRCGDRVLELTEDEFLAWAGPAAPPLDRDALRERGLGEELIPDSAVAFARGHRVVPLLLGLGPDPTRPGQVGLGTIGREVISVEQDRYDLWVLATGQPTLWDAAVAWSASRSGTETEPPVLAVLSMLAPLLTAGAAYIELARPAAPVPHLLRSADAADAVLLPLGHYLGPDAWDHNGLAVGHVVRAGGRHRRLPGGDAYRIWLLAHGLGTQAVGEPWTTAGLARTSGLTAERFASAVAELVDRGLVVAIDPDASGAVEVARQLRWHPLLVGHGTRAQWSGEHGIGLPDDVWIRVGDLAHALWRWAPAADNLADVSRELASEPSSSPAPDAEEVMLATLLRHLHPLLAEHAGYLDLVGAP